MISKEIREKALRAYQEKLKRNKAYELKCRTSSIETLKSKLEKYLEIKNPRIDRKNVRFHVMKGIQIGLTGDFQDNISAISICPDCKKELHKGIHCLENLGEVLNAGKVIPLFHTCINPNEIKSHDQQIADKVYELLNLLGIQ